MKTYQPNSLFAERYALIEQRHESGNSVLWLAHDKLEHDAPVMVKIFQLREPLNAEQAGAFRAYYADLMKHEDPRLLHPLAFDVEGGMPYLILPHCPAGSARDLLIGIPGGAVGEVTILRMLAHIGRALAYLHAQAPALLHRQITPEDILLTEDEQFVLADFGRTEAIIGILSGGTLRASEFTPAYSPPEYFRAQPIFSAAGDIYALGCVALEMATGQVMNARAPRGRHGGSLYTNKPAQLSDATWAMLQRCTDGDLDARPSAEELAKWAEWSLRVAPPDAARGGVPPRRANALLVVGIVTMLAALGIAALTLLPRGGDQTAATTSPAVETHHVTMRLHGSNTIGAELAPALVKAYLTAKGARDIVKIPQRPDEVLIRYLLPNAQAPEAVEIFAHGSTTAFEDLGATTCDIGMSSRRIKDDEARKLAALGDMGSPACEHVLALDGVSVIAHPHNPVKGLSKAQLAEIFAGGITNWSQVGGSAGLIKVYARDEKSGTWDTFKNLVLGKDKQLIAGAERLEDSDQLRQLVASNPNSIGFVGLAYTQGVSRLSISDGAAAIAPTPFTIGTEEYPLARRLYLYTPAQPATPMIKDFIEFALSDQGQQLCSRTGFVGQTVQVAALPPAAAAAGDARRDPLRLNFDLRFRTGSATLDNKAIRDIDRLIAAMKDPGMARRGLRLSGYSDNTGDPRANIRLSRERAQAVADMLTARGIAVKTITGYGAENPIASNASKEGRDRNRRVEVWVE